MPRQASIMSWCPYQLQTNFANSHPACSWSLPTYMALGPILLDTLVIKLWRFNVEQALGMPLLTARETKVQIFNFGQTSVAALVAWYDLSHIMEIRELTVWAAADDGICLLGSLPSLRALTIVSQVF